MTQFQARQGDVMIVAKPIPTTARPVSRGGDVLVAEGEATGHTHRMVAVLDAAPEITDEDRRAVATLFVDDADGKRYLRVQGGDAQLVHDEHGAVAVAPGDYEVIQQRQAGPDDDVRKVVD